MQSANPATKLHNFGARSYSVAEGRFTSKDPIAGDLYRSQSLNPYAYALNNPLKYQDASGYYATANDLIPPHALEPLGMDQPAWMQIGANMCSLGSSACAYYLSDDAIKNGYQWEEFAQAGALDLGGMIIPGGKVAGILSNGFRARTAGCIMSKSKQYEVLGTTDKYGNITIKPGLSPSVHNATLRHEKVHSFLSPSKRGKINELRAYLRMAGYSKSHALRYIEEAIAEGYATKSLKQGLKHPMRGYSINSKRVAAETGATVAIIGVTGWQLGK